MTKASESPAPAPTTDNWNGNTCSSSLRPLPLRLCVLHQGHEAEVLMQLRPSGADAKGESPEITDRPASLRKSRRCKIMPAPSVVPAAA
jgi:hypothetical protein